MLGSMMSGGMGGGYGVSSSAQTYCRFKNWNTDDSRSKKPTKTDTRTEQTVVEMMEEESKPHRESYEAA